MKYTIKKTGTKRFLVHETKEGGILIARDLIGLLRLAGKL